MKADRDPEGRKSMEQHLDHHFDDALGALKQQILLMGSKVESMLRDCVHALSGGDMKLAEGIRARDIEIDEHEMSVDEQSLELLARFQPAGRDLRLISRGLKIATDLERIGDLSVNIANRVIEIRKEGEPPIDLKEMSEIVQGMLRDALDAFVHSDVVKADAVLKKDDIVDRMTERMVTELVDRSMKKPYNLKRYFPATSIVRHLERVADHATNIAELAIFVDKGRDVRHGHLL